jgi:hypothetical protein
MILRLAEQLEVPLRERNRLPRGPGIVIPLRHRHEDAELSLFSLTAVVGTPLDVTVQELAIAAFYPADQATAAALRCG